MTANERRMAILDALCERRQDKVCNLAFEFDVSERTIQRDIENLSCSYPIYTTQGNGGGVYMVDGYRMGKKYLTEKQEALLEKLAIRLTGDEFQTMQEILKTFKGPRRKV